MGFLSHAVGAVVDAVEGATGQQGSATGDAVEQQAANVENAADDAASAASSAVTDPVGFLSVVLGAATDGAATFARNTGAQLRDGLETWLEGTADATGMQLPDRLTLASIVAVGLHVAERVGGTLEKKATHLVGPGAVAAGEAGAGVVVDLVRGGPSAAWNDVRGILTGIKHSMAGPGREASERARRASMNAAAKLGIMLGFPSAEDAIRNAGDGPRALWNALRNGMRHGAASGPGAVSSIVRQAEDEHRRMIAALRKAIRALERERGPRASSPLTPAPELRRVYRSTADGIELHRLTAQLIAYARGGKPKGNSEVLRHFADATTAAARAVLLHFDLIRILQIVHHVARRGRAALAKPLRGPR